MHNETTIAAVAELRDLGAWIDAMPNVPGHHSNADALAETYQNVVDSVLQEHPSIANAVFYAQGAEDGYDTEAEMWEAVARAMEIELTTAE